MISMLVNIDVPDLAAAIDFYRQAFGSAAGFSMVPSRRCSARPRRSTS